jgi:hypothetical protein
VGYPISNAPPKDDSSRSKHLVEVWNNIVYNCCVDEGFAPLYFITMARHDEPTAVQHHSSGNKEDGTVTLHARKNDPKDSLLFSISRAKHTITVK